MTFGSGTAASEGAGRHPNGEYPAVITLVEGRYYEDQPLYEIHLKTPHGKAKKTVWGFDDHDKNMCDPDNVAYDAEQAKKTLKSISNIKRMLIDLGLVTAEEVKVIGWDQLVEDYLFRGGESPMVGKNCTAVFMDHMNGSGKQIIFINAPKSKGNGKAAAPAKGRQKRQPAKQQQQQQEQSTPPPDLQPAPQLESGDDGPPDLDNIPY